MAKTVTLSDKIIVDATIASKECNRSVAEQIEHWVMIGKIAEENPDLNFDFVKGILISLQEAKAGKLEEYIFD